MMRLTSLRLSAATAIAIAKAGFARACRTNAKRYRVFANRVDIALLARGFRTNRAAAIREQNIFAQNARREFALPQKFDGAARVIDRRVASRGGHFNEIAEQSREALHFRGIARKRNGIASNRDARGKRPLHLAQHAIGRAHDLLHAHPFGSVSVICVSSVEMGSLLMKAPLTCICRTTSLYQSTSRRL